MAIIARKPQSDFTPPPSGTFQAVCCDVVDLGLAENKFKPGTMQHRIRVKWQLDEEMLDGRRYMASKVYTLSLSEKSNLYADLIAWRGRPFTDEELDGFDLERLVGINCMVTIVEVKGQEGRTFAKVQAVSKLPKNMVSIQVEGYTRERDREGYEPPAGASPLQNEDESTFGEVVDDDGVPF